VWWLLWLGLAVLAVYGLHRIALWAEGRGWIYYRIHRAPVGAAGMAMLEVTSLLDPAAEHVIEETRAEQIRVEQGEAGEGLSGPGQ
jgi:hypothetical protein